MRDKERERWIDGVKGIAIILVVLGHVLDGYIGANMYADSQNILKNLSYIIKIFHMPLFIIISGYLYEKYVLYSSNINKKIANFMLMYFIWNFIWWVFKLSFSRYTISDISYFDLIKVPIKAMGVYWYLYVLSALYWIMSKTKINSDNYKVAFIISLILAMVYRISLLSYIGDNVVTIVKILYYFVFFLYGQNLGRNGIKYTVRKKVILVTGVTVCCIYIAMYSCQKISSIKTYIIPVIALFLSSFVIYLVEKYEKFIPKVICIIGKRSLEIYLLHRFVIIIARLMFKNVFNIFLTVTLVTIIGVIAPMIIKKICVKIRIDKILFNPYSLIAKQK